MGESAVQTKTVLANYGRENSNVLNGVIFRQFSYDIRFHMLVVPLFLLRF